MAVRPTLDGPTSDDSPLVPRGAEETALLLNRLGFAAEDAADALATRILPERHPQLWALLERGHRDVLRGLQPDAPRWSLPELPDELGAMGRFFPLHVFLSTIESLRAWHAARGVAEDVTWATLQDLGRGVAIHRATHGVGGLDKTSWLSLHFHGELYELGRLQFELKADSFGLHIPATGPLTPQACDASLDLARDFFALHFPDPARATVQCASWLLDEQLADYLREDSNIVRFQRRFSMVPGATEDDLEPLRFVFRHVPTNLAELARDTTLQRALVDHLDRGGHWRIRTGWFPLEPAPPPT